MAGGDGNVVAFDGEAWRVLIEGDGIGSGRRAMVLMGERGNREG